MFICACIRGLRGSPRMLRAPSARGPNSIRPLNQPTIFSSASSRATVSQQRRARSSRSYGAPDRLEERLDLRVGERRARGTRPSCASLPGVTARGCLQCRCQMSCATPSAPPASPAAGWIQSSLERTLAQQPAVADAVERHAAGQAQVLEAGLAVHRARHPQHDLFAHDLHRAGEVHLPLRQLASPARAAGRRTARRTPRSSS